MNALLIIDRFIEIQSQNPKLKKRIGNRSSVGFKRCLIQYRHNASESSSSSSHKSSPPSPSPNTSAKQNTTRPPKPRENRPIPRDHCNNGTSTETPAAEDDEDVVKKIRSVKKKIRQIELLEEKAKSVIAFFTIAK